MQKTFTFKDRDGYAIWEFDTQINPHGPISVTESPLEEKNLIAEEDLPVTKRQYLNPSNGKMVGYARAKNLGLIQDLNLVYIFISIP